MNKLEIKEKIINFKTDEEIIDFIKSRILELENNLDFDTIGFGYKNLCNNYISKKIKYVIGQSFFGEDFPSLEFDDITPYFSLIKSLSKSKEYLNELYLFTPLMFEIFNYLSSEERKKNIQDTIIKRDGLYLDALKNKDKSISVKRFSDEKLGLCGENAGIAHNFFKILDIDSQLVFGKRNDEEHAFNIIFPNGYNNMPAVIYDPSHIINFINENGVNYSMGYFKVLSDEEYNNMLLGHIIQINLEGTINNLIRYYPMLSGCSVDYKNACYSIGFGEPLDKEDNKFKKGKY